MTSAFTLRPAIWAWGSAWLRWDAYITDEKNRGRKETRYHIVSEVTDEFQEISYEWPGLKTVGVVMSFRQEGDDAPEAPMISYYISSAELSAKKLAEAAR